MYNNALENESTTMIHLFGIKYADEIRLNGYTSKRIVSASGIKDSYFAEVNKGIKLSRYVQLKDR